MESEFRAVAHRSFLHSRPEELPNIVPRSLLKIKRKFGLLPPFCLKDIGRQHRKSPYRLIYANTCATTLAIAPLKKALRVPVIMHVHELEAATRLRAGEAFHGVIPYVDQFVAVSGKVEQNLRDRWHIPKEKIVAIPAFVVDDLRSQFKSTGKEVRKRLGIPGEAFVAGGCGSIGWTKGTDLFLLLAKAVTNTKPDRPVHFVWLGAEEKSHAFLQMQIDVRKLDLTENVHIVTSQPNPMDYFQVFDIFLLTSREDSFPLACLENAILQKPIVCFDNATGSTEYIDSTCGHVSPYMDVDDMAKAVLRFSNDRELCRACGQRIHDRAAMYTADRCGSLVLRLIMNLADDCSTAAKRETGGHRRLAESITWRK